MIYDECEHLMPTRYICKYNQLCYKSPFMNFYRAKPNNILLLKILLIFCPKYHKYMASGSAICGDLDVLKWARENGC